MKELQHNPEASQDSEWSYGQQLLRKGFRLSTKGKGESLPEFKGKRSLTPPTHTYTRSFSGRLQHSFLMFKLIIIYPEFPRDSVKVAVSLEREKSEVGILRLRCIVNDLGLADCDAYQRPSHDSCETGMEKTYEVTFSILQPLKFFSLPRWDYIQIFGPVGFELFQVEGLPQAPQGS